MARKEVVSRGKCSLCNGVLDKSVMATHLRSCRKKQPVPEKPRKVRVFHLLAEGRYQPGYWMHLEIPTNATLKVLDRSFGDTWLECCGHMSQFEIQGTRYVVEAIDLDDEEMDVKLEGVLLPKMVFLHVYDFGYTTHLKLRVVSEYESNRADREVHVLARNEPPAIPCGCCGKPATQICMECSHSAQGWLCDACGAQHKCGEEAFLPVVNSPRTGVCGYTG